MLTSSSSGSSGSDEDSEEETSAARRLSGKRLEIDIYKDKFSAVRVEECVTGSGGGGPTALVLRL
jgi:hypothetical protein